MTEIHKFDISGPEKNMGLAAVMCRHSAYEVVVLEPRIVFYRFGNNSDPVGLFAAVDGNGSYIGVGVDPQKVFILSPLVGSMFSGIPRWTHEFAAGVSRGVVGVVYASQETLTCQVCVGNSEILSQHSGFPGGGTGSSPFVKPCCRTVRGFGTVPVAQVASLVVIGVVVQGIPETFEVVQTGGSLRSAFCLLQGGQQHGGENGNDGDHNK